MIAGNQAWATSNINLHQQVKRKPMATNIGAHTSTKHFHAESMPYEQKISYTFFGWLCSQSINSITGMQAFCRVAQNLPALQCSDMPTFTRSSPSCWHWISTSLNSKKPAQEIKLSSKKIKYYQNNRHTNKYDKFDLQECCFLGKT